MLFPSFRDTWDGGNWQQVQGCPAFVRKRRGGKKMGRLHLNRVAAEKEEHDPKQQSPSVLRVQESGAGSLEGAHSKKHGKGHCHPPW